MRKICVAVTMATLALAGCSTSSGNNASRSDSVRVLTHDSFSLPDDALARFEDESGAKLVTSAPGDTGTVLNQLKLQKDNPAADVVFGIDTFTRAEAEESGVVEDLVAIDRGDVCINVDHAYFTENNLAQPETFEDLAKPEYKDLLVVTNPVTSSPGLAFLAGTVETYGDEWPQYWNQLLDNGTKVVDSWSTAYYSEFSGAAENGTFPLVLSYASSPAESDGATGTALGTCVRQEEFAGVVTGADNPEGAQEFIDFLLEPETQKLLPEAMYMYPIDDSVELPAAWAEHAQLAEDPIEPEVDREKVLKEWTSLWEAR